MKYVAKAWGYEEWLVNNELYCLKKLIVNRGMQCSLHRHHVKDETFHVEQGSVWLEVEEDTHLLLEGESIRIPPGTWHRFRSLEGAIIIEVSTTHDDADVERREESRPVSSGNAG